MSKTSPVHVEDLVPVRSRISWGAVIAGSVLALALYFLLTLMGAAVGFSIGEKATAESLTLFAVIGAIFATMVSLFVGGFVASQFTVGENEKEAVLYGLLVWAVVFAMLLWLMASGVKVGFSAMVGVSTSGGAIATAVGQNTTQGDWEELARKAGVSQQQLDDWKQKAKDAPAAAKRAAEDPANKEKAEEAARKAGVALTKVTWVTFIGTLGSMIAAAVGALVGAGPTFQIFVPPTRSVARA